MRLVCVSEASVLESLLVEVRVSVDVLSLAWAGAMTPPTMSAVAAAPVIPKAVMRWVIVFMVRTPYRCSYFGPGFTRAT